jgi:hypothetical protein
MHMHGLRLLGVPACPIAPTSPVISEKATDEKVLLADYDDRMSPYEL